MKRMLFNATHQEELRVAIVDGQKLLDLDIESSVYQQRKGNIYKGVVTRVEPSLEAAFVEYGANRQGFLPLKEISRTLFRNFGDRTPMSQVRIKDVIKEGQEFLVQVEKEERGNKGAALTTFISLAGRFLVLMPNNSKGGGISRRIEGEERAELRRILSELTVPEAHALIARTACIGRTREELQWDLDYLLQLWDAIDKVAEERPAPFLVYQESNLLVRSIRDYARADIAEILIDDPEVYERAQRFMQQVMPNMATRLKLYSDSTPLFSRYQIENQIESAYDREVRLQSGGALVIDHTEALISIDVNSARATKGADIEETALNTNLEAATEIARQLKLRDMGGLVVIDFIDMSSNRNQRKVEARLADSLRGDRARTQVGRISRFGLMEMSRQRLRPSISDSNYLACPRCHGTGQIRGTQSSALSILRIIEEEALKENTEVIHAYLPVASAMFLLNEKRHEVSLIEQRCGTTIYILATKELEVPNFEIKRLRAADLDELDNKSSYQLEHVEEDESAKPGAKPASSTTMKAEKPAVAQIIPSAPPAPAPSPATTETVARKQPVERGRFVSWLKSLFGEEPQTEKTSQPEPARQTSSQTSNEQRAKGRHPHSRRGGRQNSRGNNSGQQNRKQGQNNRNRNANRGKGQQRPQNQKNTRTDVARNDNATDKEVNGNARPADGNKPGNKSGSDRKSNNRRRHPGNRSRGRKPSDKSGSTATPTGDTQNKDAATKNADKSKPVKDVDAKINQPKPESIKSEAGKPDASKPDTVRKDSIKQSAEKPAETASKAAKSDSAKSEKTENVGKKPESKSSEEKSRSEARSSTKPDSEKKAKTGVKPEKQSSDKPSKSSAKESKTKKETKDAKSAPGKADSKKIEPKKADTAKKKETSSESKLTMIETKKADA